MEAERGVVQAGRSAGAGSSASRRGRAVLAFVHMSKTAGTTMKFILRNSTWLRHADVLPLGDEFTEADYRFLRRVFVFGVRSLAGHGLMPARQELSGRVEYFTFVREPLSRCLSHYEQRLRAERRRGVELDFEAFLSNEWMRDRQVRHLAGGPDLEAARALLRDRFLFTGLTERFDESLRILRVLSPVRLRCGYERRHVTKDRSARERILADPGLRRLLEEANTLDQELYAYVRDELYPAQRERAGVEPDGGGGGGFALRRFPVRFYCTRGYNMGVYRNLTKLRRRFWGGGVT